MNVATANIEGTYKLGEGGIFVFAPNASDYCQFKANVEYSKTDDGECRLKAYSPLDKEHRSRWGQIHRL